MLRAQRLLLRYFFVIIRGISDVSGILYADTNILYDVLGAYYIVSSMWY